IGRSIWLDILVELAVAIGVEHERRPALRVGGVAGLLEDLGVEPARHLSSAAEPERVVGVIAELRMVRAEAEVDEGVLHRLRIKHGSLAYVAIDWKHLGGRMIRALLAEGRV